MSAFNFFLGWAIVLVGVWAGLKYEGSRAAIYYLAWLATVLLLVSHYQEVSQLFFNTDLTGAVVQPSPTPGSSGAGLTYAP